MHYLSIDYLIVYVFLAITLIIGLRAGRGIKDIREYANANKLFGTGALVLTWLATDIAGQTILDTTGSVRTEGIIQVLAVGGGWGIALLMQALFFAPKFVHFSNCITLGDVMGQLYKSPSQVMTGILSSLTALCITGMELTVLGILCESLLGIDYRWGVGLGGLMLVIYTAHGGIKSVTYTDLFQFLVLIVMLPIITVIALKQAGGIKQVLMQVPATQFQIFQHSKLPHYLALFLSLSVFQFSVIDPALIQRILMGKTKQQLRNQFFIVSAVLFAVMLALLILGLSSIVLFPDEPSIPIFLHIVNNLLPVGIKGLAVAGIFAITMATFDSFLHAAGLTLVHDVIRPIYNRKGNTLNELRWARYITVLVGFIAMAVGLTRSQDLYGFVLVSYQFTGPLLAFPLFAGVLGLKPDRYAFYTAGVVTLITFVLAKSLLPEQYQYIATLMSVIANGITFLGIHAVRHKGLMIVNYSQEQEYVWKPHPKNALLQIKSYLPTPKNIIKYSQIQVKKYGASYILLGLFGLINYIIPYFMWEYEATDSYNIMLYLRFIGAIACGLLVTKDKWPLSLTPYLPTFWHITLLYCLPFTNTLMFFLTQGSIEWLINVTLSIMLLIVLVDWLSFIMLTLLGIALGLLFYSQVIGPINMNLNFTMSYLLIYQGIFATLIGLLFARRKQQRFDQLATENQSLSATHQEDRATLLETFKEKVRLLKTLKHAGIQDLSKAVKLIRAIRTEGQQTLQASQPLNHLFQQLDSTVTPIAVALERIESRATDYLRLDINPITIDSFLEKVQAQLPNQHLQFQLYTQHQKLVCDPIRMQKVLINSINTVKAAMGQSTDIYISLHDTALTYPIHSLGKDYVKQIAAIGFNITTKPTRTSLQASYEAQMNGTYLPISETVQELLLTINHRIIKAHYGYTNVNISQQTDYETYLYIIPVDVNEVRPRDMNDPYMELGAELVRADDTYPGAAEQEASFLAAVQQKTPANIETIKTALEMIKWYHGAKNRHSGEPFYLHPLAVAQIVLDWNPDEATILGALLHDTVEDTAMLLENIDMMFGPEVVRIVDGVTHFESTQESFYKIKLSNHENILMLLEVEDKRALQVKIADRIHNMRTISGHQSHTKKQKIAEETLQFFVPLAKALGLEQAAKELKEMSVPLLNELTQKK